MKKDRYMMALLSLLFAQGCSVVGIRNYEQPAYTVIAKNNDFEIREYPEMLVAKTQTTGDYDESTSANFRRLARFIFGDNVKKTEIAMTGPVVVEGKNEKNNESISMTGPVLTSGDESQGVWSMQFVMPKRFSMETLPQPTDPEISIAMVPKKQVAVLRYRGRFGEKKNKKMWVKLKASLQKAGVATKEEPRYAGYDPPWALPFLRRNEVQVELLEAYPKR